MVPSGEIIRSTIRQLAGVLGAGDLVIEGSEEGA
jgi:6-phosphogluconate dehydrogenase (decarboxylating)